jgi:hypothetical protein
VFLNLLTILLPAQPFEIDTLWWTGPEEDRINVVFLSDGYQSSQLEQYLVDVQVVVDHFFRESPLNSYKSYFNVVAIKVPSIDSGAKKNAEDKKNTYFGSSYNYAGIERLLVAGRVDLAQEILFDQFPLFDQAVLIVNDQKYGGSGGWLATTSVHVDAPEIALHEIGHSFAGLADEYWAGEQFAVERPNLTQEKDRSKTRWRNWLGYKSVDVYPHSEAPTWFRPHQNCKMRVLNPSFCPVCQETIVKRIHDMVVPLESFSPDSSQIELTSDSMICYVGLLEPKPNTLQTTWTIAGEVYQKGAHQIIIEASDIKSDTLLVEVKVLDTTLLVRDFEHDRNHTYSVSWTLRADLVSSLGQSIPNLDFRLFPNPARSEIFLEINGRIHEATYPIILQLFDLDGALLSEGIVTKSHHSVSVEGLATGVFILRLSNKDGFYSNAIIKL